MSFVRRAAKSGLGGEAGQGRAGQGLDGGLGWSVVFFDRLAVPVMRWKRMQAERACVCVLAQGRRRGSTQATSVLTAESKSS